MEHTFQGANLVWDFIPKYKEKISTVFTLPDSGAFSSRSRSVKRDTCTTSAFDRIHGFENRLLPAGPPFSSSCLTEEALWIPTSIGLVAMAFASKRLGNGSRVTSPLFNSKLASV